MTKVKNRASTGVSTPVGHWARYADPYVSALVTSVASTTQNAIPPAATNSAPNTTVAAIGASTAIAARAGVQSRSSRTSTTTSSSTDTATRPSRRSWRSAAASWPSTDSGRSSTTSNVPLRTCWITLSLCPTSRSAVEKPVDAIAKTSTTSTKLSPAIDGTWWKTAKISTKSRPMPSAVPNSSTANEARYVAWPAIPARSSAAYTRVSATLQHQLPGAAVEDHDRGSEQAGGPGRLHGHQAERGQ